MDELVEICITGLDPEQSKKVQEWFFARGIYWRDTGNKVREHYRTVRCVKYHGRVCLIASRGSSYMTYQEFYEKYMLQDEAFKVMEALRCQSTD